MLHTLVGTRVRKLILLPPLFAGAVAPDVLDKFMHYTLTSYPGRGVFHSAVILTLLFLLAWLVNRQRLAFFVAFYLGTMLHLAQDQIEPLVALWPFWGDFYIHEPMPILKKVHIFYVEKQFSWLWTVEIVSLVYCVVYLAVGFVNRLRGGTLRPADR